MLHNRVFRKCPGELKLTKSQEKSNHLIQMDDMKQFVKKIKRIGGSKSNNKYKQLGYKNRNMCHDRNEKRKKTKNGKNRTAKSRKNQDVQ